MAVKKWIFDLNILQKSRIPRMELVQGDTDANVFQIHLKTLERYTEVPLDLTDSYVTVTVKKADDTIVVGEAQIIDSTNGIIEYTCRGNELSYPGLVIATIEVYDTTHIKRFTTTQFKFYVVEQLDDGSGIPSTTEYTVLSDLIAQTQSVVTNENERIENENTRIANENIRQENESIRQNNEQARITAENNRVNAESIRDANENERINNENIRQANEETRNTAEANREQAENLRQMAEQERINAENARVAAENARNVAELARKNAENIRRSNESARISEENTRILQENARVQVENERIANENIREANEAVRQNNESVRITAEGNRVQAEAIREANEAERILNENTRIANENTRQSNEAIRRNNESVRQSNEATRINNENIRQQQEQARQASMADIENRWNTLTTAQQQDAEVINARTSTVKNKTFPALTNRIEELEQDTITPVYNETITIDGGIGSIPSNAAEGQVSVTVKGNTETDEEGNTKSTVSAFRIRTKDDADNVISEAYVIAKDPETNKIVNLNSLPNGVRDRIYQGTDGKWYLEKNIGISKDFSECNWTTIQAGHTDNFYAVQCSFTELNIDLSGKHLYQVSHKILNYTGNGGANSEFLPIDDYFYRNNNLSGLPIKVPKSAYSGEWTLEETQEWFRQNDVKLIYQLAEPVEIPVQVSGTLVSYPSGTVYIEHYVPDAGIYTDKMEILHQDLPIKTLEKLSKVDFATGLETKLDVSQAVISQDKLFFTHPELSEGDIVFFVYEYDRESTEGETEIEYYDSRYVIKDSATGKFYKWGITVANGVPSISLQEV